MKMGIAAAGAFAAGGTFSACSPSNGNGATPDDVEQDDEGLRTTRALGHNMAFLIKAINQAEQAGVKLAPPEPRVYTNFIR